jgi:hypothetical protein
MHSSKIQNIIAIVHLSEAESEAETEAEAVLHEQLHPENVFAHDDIDALKRRMAALLQENCPERRRYVHADGPRLGPAAQGLLQLFQSYEAQDKAASFTQDMFPLSAQAGKITMLEREASRLEMPTGTSKAMTGIAQLRREQLDRLQVNPAMSLFFSIFESSEPHTQLEQFLAICTSHTGTLKQQYIERYW